MATPMMQQYNKLKKQHKDAILLFRLGDFYEAFNDDAKLISKVLSITLTGRGQGENRHPMAGIPHHALKGYLSKLIKNGHKVAIAEQMEEPEEGKSIVERDIVKIVTAGTITDLDNLEESTNNYLAAIHKDKKKDSYYLAYCDLTTGEFETTTLETPSKLQNELFKITPNEILLVPDLLGEIDNLYNQTSLQIADEELWDLNKSKDLLNEHFGTKTLKGFGYSDNDLELIPAAVILDYLRQTQKTDLEHIQRISKVNQENYMSLDAATISNLELVWPLRNENNKATLFAVLNECQTAMGQRLLRNWILHPLINSELLNSRLEAVSEAMDNIIITEQLRDQLDNICDLERVISKLGTGSINARDFIFLKTSLESIINLVNETSVFENKLLNLGNNLSEGKIKTAENIISLVAEAIVEDPPVTIMGGGIIKKGFNKELDEIINIEEHGKEWLKKLETEEKQRTGISSLKVKFNNVFGYYIEISKANLDKVPDNYVRKQTLVNSERFITEELKTWENKILNAGEQRNQLEYDLFNQVRDQISENIDLFLEISQIIARIDVLTNFAYISRQNNYKKPQINSEGILEIKEGRHPVVEKFISEEYIPNDLSLDDKKQQVIILTGPNMSGKSTYIRQIALITLIAQIGCFVPAAKANIDIVDRIFTRVGAADNLASGESTFMVEMNETANILNNATRDSLIILDEVGRGTSTYDGVAIAWSIVEYIHNVLGAKTLFATHYHELIDLEKKMEKIKNYNVDVLEEGEEVQFTRKVVQGGTDQSYGVHVAKMAGVPSEVIKRANQILLTLEQDSMLDVRSIESELITNPETTEEKRIKEEEEEKKRKEEEKKKENDIAVNEKGQLQIF